MATLEKALQELHEARKRIEITWLWDGGIDVKAGDAEWNFGCVSETLPWLHHWYGLKGSPSADTLVSELEKMYDSEINVTIGTGGKRVFVALGNDFTGYVAEGEVSSASAVLSWLQKSIHRHFPVSKYDVERLGGMFTD